MFYYIKGKLAYADNQTAVIDANGVGYKMTISSNTYSALPPHLSTAEMPEAKLYTYMAVREDGVELFGFISLDELDVFKLLNTVSGVGPKAAISILSVFTPEKLAFVISSEDTKSICKANGIGSKTAARIVLELKDKLGKISISSDVENITTESTEVKGNQKNKVSEVENALMVLGYTRSQIIKAISNIDFSKYSVEEIIKIALKNLF